VASKPSYYDLVKTDSTEAEDLRQFGVRRYAAIRGAIRPMRESDES
jgi:hypothetical protein